MTSGQDVLALERFADESDGRSRQVRSLTHACGQVRLIAGPDGNRRHDIAAGGDVDEVDSVLLEPSGDLDGVVECDSAFGPVRRGQAHEHGDLFTHLGAGGVDDLEQQTSPVLKGSAVGVGAGVAQRRQELVDEIPVRGVDLDEVEPGLDRPARRGSEGFDHLGDLRLGQGTRFGESVEGQCGRSHGLPTAFVDGHAAVAVGPPFGIGRGLAACVGELDAGGSALRVEEVDDRDERVALLVVPQSQVLGRDPCLRGDSGGFDDDGARSPAGHRTVVDGVPRCGNSVEGFDGVLAHGRNPDAVAERESPQGERFEQQMRHSTS